MSPWEITLRREEYISLLKADYIFAEPTNYHRLDRCSNCVANTGECDGLHWRKFRRVLLPLSMVAGIQHKLLMMTWIKFLLAGVPPHTIDLLTLSRSQDLNLTKISKRLQVAEFLDCNECQKEKGLVDEIGGIENAITYAANLAELEDYKVEYYGEELSPKELLLKRVN